jgi:hypothetical protein
MSQTRFLQEDYAKKIQQAAKNAAINVTIADLVAARNIRHADGCKRLGKSSNPYKHVIALLHLVGSAITYDALVKRVSRALSESSVASSLSHHEQVSTLHSPLRTLPKKPHHTMINHTKLLNSSLALESGPNEAPMPKRSWTRKPNVNALIPIAFEYSIKHNTYIGQSGSKRKLFDRIRNFGNGHIHKVDDNSFDYHREIVKGEKVPTWLLLRPKPMPIFLVLIWQPVGSQDSLVQRTKKMLLGE